MHANHREERDEIGAGEIAAGVGLKSTTTGDTLAIESAPIVLESMTFPDPVISVAVEPKSKADQDKLGQRPCAARRGGSDLPRRDRRGDRPDDHLRHGRAPPRDHRRPPQARVQRRRERRPPAGRLPRDDLQAGREDPGQVRPADRRLGPVRRRGDQPAVRRSRARATSSSTRSSAARSQGVHQADRRGHPGGDGLRHPRRVSRRRRQDRADRRLVPRRRLERARIQDRRLDGLQGGDEAREAEAARADDGGRGDDARGLPRRRDGQPQLPPRTHREHGPARQRPGDQGTRPAERDVRLRHRPAVRCHRAAQISPCSSTGTKKCRHRSRPRSPSEARAPKTRKKGIWPSRSSSARSRTSTSAPSVTSTTARRR